MCVCASASVLAYAIDRMSPAERADMKDGEMLLKKINKNKFSVRNVADRTHRRLLRAA